MAAFIWLAGIVALLVWTSRKPKGKKAVGVFSTALWGFASPVLLFAMFSSPGNQQNAVKAVRQEAASATTTKPNTLQVLVSPTDARVTVTGPNQFYRKVIGSQKFGNLRPGSYKISVSKPGYVPTDETVDISGEVSKTYKIRTQAAINAENKALQAQAESEARCNGVDLIIENWNWGDQYDFAIAEGRVTNISGQSLERVMAKVSYFTNSGEFITSHDALIDYTPILNGQSSPFKVMGTYNPAMASGRLELAEMWGTTYKTISREDWKKYRCGS